MILEDIITRLRTDLGCLKPGIVVWTAIEGFKKHKEVFKQDDNAKQNYVIFVNNT